MYSFRFYNPNNPFNPFIHITNWYIRIYFWASAPKTIQTTPKTDAELKYVFVL